MTIKGYNVWLNGQKVNDQLVPFPRYKFEGLNSKTKYPVTITAVDLAGNESVVSESFLFETLALPPINTGPISESQAMAVDALVAADMAKSKQAGTILQITGPTGSYLKAYGKTGLGGRAVSVDDHVRIGSNTKMFIAMAAMLELDKNSFALTDKISQYVPGVTNGDKITIHMLLTMQSGLADFWSWNNPYIMFLLGVFPTGPFSAADCERSARNSPSNFEPGTKFEYSNSNAVLVGMLVEAVSGMTIRDYLIKKIIEPLGLTETTWPTNSGLPQPGMSGSAFNPEIAGAAGCLTSTINDMTKFANELRDGKLLSPETHFYWLNTYYNIGSNTLYKNPPTSLGYGNFIFRFGRWMGHGGSIPTGFDSGILFDTLTGATISIVNNAQIATAPGFYSVSHDIAALLYPGSMDEPSYDLSAGGGRKLFPKPAELKVQTFSPGVVVATRNPSVSPPPAELKIVGGTPGSTVVLPAPAQLAISGKVPAVSVAGPPISFDAQGAGTTSNGGQWSYLHTAAEGAFVVCVVVTDRSNAVYEVTFGGTQMSLLGIARNGNRADGAYGSIFVFVLPGAAAGVSSVVVKSSAGGPCLSNTYSYNGAAAASIAGTAGGDALPITQQVACASPQRVLQVFANSSCGLFPGAGPMTPSGGVQRDVETINGSVAMTVSDTDVDATFSAASSSSYWWSGLAVAMRPGRNVRPEPAVLSITGGVPDVRTPVAVSPAPAALVAQAGVPAITVRSLFGFDAASWSQEGYTAVTTWQHQAEAGCFVFVDVASGAPETTVKYGDDPMTMIGIIGYDNNGGNAGVLRRYGLALVPGGVKTITVRSNAYSQQRAAAVSYRGVSAVSTIPGSYGATKSMQQPADIGDGKLLVQSFAGYSTLGGGLTVAGGVNRVNVGGGTRMSMSESDASTTFLATAGADLPWSSLLSVVS